VESRRIILTSILAAIVFGTAHDLATAHYSPAYFLPPHHIQIVDTQSPILLALIWGVLATFWVGAGLGALLAVTGRWGKWPKLTWDDMRRRITFGVTLLWALAMLAGVGLYFISEIAMRENPKLSESDRRLVIVASVHVFSYSAATVLGLILAILNVRERWKRSQASLPLENPTP
jgi:hypothetical protein